MSDPIEEAMRARHEELAQKREALYQELLPIEDAWRRLGLALAAMDQATTPESAAFARDQHSLRGLTLVAETITSEPRVRPQEVQDAIDAQGNISIPPGTLLYCAQGCDNGHMPGFPDQMAMRTHTGRSHGREPLAEERTPR